MNRLLCLFLLPLLLVGCSQDGPTTPSTSDDYTPVYTEPIGTTYGQEYFPLDAGRRWSYRGTSTTIQNVTSSMTYLGVTEDTAYIDTSVMGYQTISRSYGPVDMALPQGSEQLYMVQESLTMVLGGDTSGGTGWGYYQITDSSVNIRAFVEEDSTGHDTAVVDNMVYLKMPLVVGDSWQTDGSPLMGDLGLWGDSAVSDIQVISTYYVIGRETVTLNGGQYSALRIDCITEEMVNVSDSAMSMQMASDAFSSFYFVADTGLVGSIGDVRMEMAMSMAVSGVQMEQTSEGTTRMEQGLESLSTGNQFLPKESTSQSGVPVPAADRSPAATVRMYPMLMAAPAFAIR